MNDTNKATLTSGSLRSVGGHHDGRGGDGAVGHIHLELVVGSCVQMTHVEGMARGGNVSEQSSVLKINLLEDDDW